LKRELNLDLSDPYYSDPTTFVTTHLRQIQDDKMYDQLLKDKKDLTILDLGANVGLVSLYCCDSAKRVIAVEAGPKQCELFKELCKNEKNIELVEAAISNKNEPVTFYMKNNPTCNSLMSIDEEDVKVEVPGINLEKLLIDKNIDKVDICKIDIEGSEMIAFTEETLKPVFDKIDLIFMEVHATKQPWREEVRKNVIKMYELFSKVGYTCEAPYVSMLMSGQNQPLHDEVVDKLICYKEKKV